MKYTIDTDLLKKDDISLAEALYLMLLKSGENLTTLRENLIKKEAIVVDMFGNTLITSGFNDRLDNCLLSADSSVPKEDALLALAIKLMELFPKGKKDGTSSYWRGNKKDIVLKLKKFYKLYGDKYSDEVVIEATRKYVESFNGNFSYMRILKYFICKDVKKTDSEGIGYIEGVSDLASFIENAGSDDIHSMDWTSRMI